MSDNKNTGRGIYGKGYYIKLKNYIVKWHILNTKSLQHVETREELTTRL